jgi:hypothetical protein
MRHDATGNNPVQRQRGQWLNRLGLWELVGSMMILSADGKMPWADQWHEHLDNPGWLKRAMVNTYQRLSEQDKAIVQSAYEEWLWYAEHFDLETMAQMGYVAHVYLLDALGQRIYSDGQFKTILLELHGTSPQDALRQLDNRWYEFIGWA